MSIIRLTVDGQRLIQQESPVIASQGVLEDSVVFDFSSEWDGYGKVALFWREEDEEREDIYQVFVDENNAAVVPWEVTQTDGNIFITVFGTQDTSVITAEILRYKIVEGLFTEGSGSEPPTPDIYQQILAIAGDVNDKFDVMDARVNELVAENTSNLTGYSLGQASYGGQIATAITSTDIVLTVPKTAKIIAGLYCPLYVNQTNYRWKSDDMYIDDTLLVSQGKVTMHIDNLEFQSGVSGQYLSAYVTYYYSSPIVLTELEDIRVAADSTTYQSAGAAVRAQVEDLQDQIDELRG